MKKALFYIAARKSGIDTPENLERYDFGRFPHWSLLADCAERCIAADALPSMEQRIRAAERVARIPLGSLLRGEVPCDTLFSAEVGFSC